MPTCRQTLSLSLAEIIIIIIYKMLWQNYVNVIFFWLVPPAQSAQPTHRFIINDLADFLNKNCRHNASTDRHNHLFSMTYWCHIM